MLLDRRDTCLEFARVLAELTVDELYVLAIVPERLLDLAEHAIVGLPLDRPGVADELACAPDAVEDHPQVPVVERVAEEEQAAARQPLPERNRDQRTEVSERQVLDVAVLGYHVAVVDCVFADQATVYLQDRRPLQHHG